MRHVQKYGLLLDRKYTNDLKASYQKATDPTLKGELAVVTGLMRHADTPASRRAALRVPPRRAGAAHGKEGQGEGREVNARAAVS